VYVVVNRCKYYGHKPYSPLFKKYAGKDGRKNEQKQWAGN
jgi:hypothetical protein